jgi:hypothetical protein
MLLVLMIAVAVMTIALLGAAQNYKRMILRDREVEMIHRGEQYERAVKRYYRKVGSYPTSIEQLENTSQVRYLRKKYKDPMSADGLWKPVHLTDIRLKAGGGVMPSGGGTGLNQSPSSTAAAGAATAAQGAAGNGLFGSTVTQTPPGPNAATGAPGSTEGGADTTGAAGTGSNATGGTTGNATGNVTGNATGSNGPAGSGAVLGGGPILGVVSKSAAEGIHSFGDKKKYNEWFFIYDPSQDKGQQMIGPYNPNANLGVGGGGAPGAQNPATPGSATTPGNATAPGTPASTPAPPNSTTP